MQLSKGRLAVAAAAVMTAGLGFVAQPAGAVPKPPQCTAYDNPGQRVQYGIDTTRTLLGPYGSQVTAGVCVVALDGFSIGSGYGASASAQDFSYDGEYITVRVTASECDFSDCRTHVVKGMVATSTWSYNCNGSPYLTFKIETVTYGTCL